MKRTLPLLALLCACASPLPATPPAGQSPTVDAPQSRAGDTWHYAVRDGYTKLARGVLEYQIDTIAEDTITVTLRHGAQTSAERYARDWSWRERPMTNLQNFRYEPAYPALPFPLVAGKTWRAYVKATDPATGRTNRVRIDGEVLGWERVKVPAGHYDALKIRRLVYAGNFDYFRSEERIMETDWYAPAAGLVVRSEGASEYMDSSRGCGGDDMHAECLTIKNDWRVMELVKHQRVSP